MTQTQQSQSTDLLFQPYTINKLTLSNRIVMAPMTRGFSPDGIPGADVAAYYRRRAENGVGLIVTEGTLINHPASKDNPNVPDFHGELALKGWEEVVKQVHEAGGKIVPQLWHLGMARALGSAYNPEVLSIGPSGLDLNGNQVTEPMTIEEIQYIIKAFTEAAVQAQTIGFDGIELHGAHGYLIDQFLWERTNQREDQYGGTLANRVRFAAEIVEAIRAATGPDFPIIFRISQWKMSDYNAKLAKTPEELEQLLTTLANAGVDAFHCSTRRFWEPEFAGSDLNLAGWAKKLTGKTAITVGSVGLDNDMTSFFAEGKGADNQDISELLERLGNQQFDLVAVGRALLNDPAWANKVREGRLDELQPFKAESLTKLY